MIANLKPYPAMKDSGVEWLGDVPEHWEMRRLGDSVHDCINGVWGRDPNGVDDLACVRVADFDRRSRRVRDPIPTIRAIAPNERRRRMLEPGDLLLEKSGGGEQQPVGVVILFDRQVASVCSNFIARMPVRNGFEPGFLTFLHSALYAIGLNTKSIKQTTGIQNLDSAAYLGEVVALPPFSEQSAIVRFLDYVDRRVRRLVRAKRKLIALLTEQKQAIIHRAVTRGLDPNVPLKDSGVEWLGQVPEHWEVVRLRRLVTRVDQGVSPQAEAILADDGWWGVLKSGCVNGGVFREREHKRLPSDFEVDERLAVSVGDVLISRACGSPRFVGSVGRIQTLNYRLILSDKTFRPVFKDPKLIDFIVRAMNSRYFRIQVELALSGAEGLANNLPVSALKGLWVAVPPLSEAVQIAAGLDVELGHAGAAITRAHREINLLNEYRTRLIADAVTGKLDVREAATALPEVDPLDSAADPDDALDPVTDTPLDDPDAALEEAEA